MTRFLLACSLLLQVAAARSQDYLNVMTFNIRLNIAVDKDDAWPYRKDHAASQILFHQVDILGVQEALHEQMTDLQERLHGYKYIGVGRDDGKEGGEYSAIFYNTARLEVLKSATFWLSEHPQQKGGKGWDAAYPRIVTWAQFRDKKTHKIFYYFNTHFDHMGQVARRESAHLLLQEVQEIAGEAPVIVSGDFNATATQEPIQVITNPADPQHLTESKGISETPHYGPDGTFTGFQYKETSDEAIDHIFIKNGVKVLQHATLSESWNGHFSSDHFPVFARVMLP